MTINLMRNFIMDMFIKSNFVEGTVIKSTNITQTKNHLYQSLLRFIDVKDNFAEGIIIKSDLKLIAVKLDNINLVDLKTINLFLDIVNR